MREIRIQLWAFPAFAAGFAALSVWLGPDASWDLRNYHIYNAFALLHGRFDVDLAPAQLQSFHAPLLDVVEQTLRRALNAHPAWLDALLALPNALATTLVLGIAWRLLPRGIALRGPLAALAAVVGATGVAGISTLGTSMSEAVPVCCLLLGLALVLKAGEGGAHGPSPHRFAPRPLPQGGIDSFRRALAAGVLAGLAAGLKLTQTPGAVGLAAALLVVAAPDGRRYRGTRLRALAAFAAGGTAAASLVAGWWWWVLWQRTGNPLFPYFNDVVRSPWGAAARMADARFLPRDPLEAVLYPLFWAFRAQTLTSEMPACDPRIALGWAGVIAILVRAAWRREWPERRVVALIAFWAVTYVLWEAQFSVLRYTLVLELVSFAPLLVALTSVGENPLPHRSFPRKRESRAPGRLFWMPAFAGMTGGGAHPRPAHASPLPPLSANRGGARDRWPAWLGLGVCFLTAMVVMLCTVYPRWGRAVPGPVAVEVRPPDFGPGSLVVLLDGAPMAYVAAFAQPDAVFAGANNNLLRPGAPGGLSRRVASTISGHAGPLWGLEEPQDQPGAADATLRFYGLRRLPGCARVRSNLDGDAILACRLVTDERMARLPP